MPPKLLPINFAGSKTFGMAKYTLRYWLRIDKPNKGGTKKQDAGTVPLHLIISVKGDRVYHNTGVSMYPEQWDDKNGKVTALGREFAKKYGLRQIDLPPITEKAESDNATLTGLQNDIKAITARFELDGVQYSSRMIKDELAQKLKPATKKDAPTDELFQFMDNYIRMNEATRKAGSLQVYRTVRRRLAEYESYAKTKVTFTNVDYAFFEAFQAYLYDAHDLNSITVAKQLSTLKTFLNYAQKRGLQVNPNYKAFRIERDTDLEVIALTQDEFNTLWDMDLTGKPRLAAIRDVFMFSCVTGMRFSDLEQLNWNQVKADYIQQTVTKTKAKLKIPLNQYSRAILARYEDCPRPLPIISNQKSNDALHDLCEEAGFNEMIEIVRMKGNRVEKNTYPKHQLISMHSGRKSFASLSLKKGMNAQNVMKIGGWRDYKSFARYVNISSEDAQEAMQSVWG